MSLGPEENQCCLAWHLPHPCSVPKSCWLFATLDVPTFWCVDITSGSSSLHCLLEFAQIHVHCVGDAIQPSHPLSLLLLLPSIFPSIRVFSNESALHIRWPKYWSFSFSINPSSEYSGLIPLGLISWLSKGLSGAFSSTTIWKHQFFSAQLLHVPNLTSAHGY